jgi:putative cardiolipin synthase
VSHALTGTAATRLGHFAAPLEAKHPGLDGFYPLSDAHDAFVGRVILAEAAERSLDVQYYIWNGDETGYLLLEALWKAAERGVRVRLLLDDNGVAGLDDTLAVLDAHPNIEVRLYNPFALRSARFLEWMTDFSRLNRRMHNKSMTADNQATIVGGRNIGNEYFAAGSGTWFADLDVLAVGPVVRDVSKAFDLYWNSASAYPAQGIVGKAATSAAQGLTDKFAEVRADPEAQTYIDALLKTTLLRQVREGTLPMEWASAQLFYDDPAKTLDESGRTDILLLSSMLEHIGQPSRSVDLVSPYFVPGEEGTKGLAAMARRGVKTRVLTNSLSVTDVSAVHAGYGKRRKDLLEAGIVLYEMKPEDTKRKAPKRSMTGSSSASLHAKTFEVDGRRIFVGSFNFDQRSANLNTELGVLIDSPVFAGRLTKVFDTEVPAGAYQVVLDKDGSLVWIERTPEGEKRYTSEPDVGLLKRGWVGFLSLFPIDWML